MANTIHVKGAVQDVSASVSTGWHVLSAVVDDENVQTYVHCDGGSVASVSGGFFSTSYPDGAAPVQVGGWNGRDVSGRQDIAELVVIAGPVSAEVRQKVEGYLAHRWGLQDALPDGHPYKSEAPTTVIEPWSPGGGSVEVDTSGIESKLNALVHRVEALRAKGMY